MKVNVQAVNFNVDKKLVVFINEKLSKLEKYYDKIVSADVYLKTENTSDKENKIAEVKVRVPGDELIIKKTCKTFEEAIDSAEESLERMIKKYKEKIRAHA
ncbi:ribosome hibernation-promoting factor, HPF/YfiA family [Flavobacterium sp.]|uniref:ribosome hibernation-promoting factor, HPF/YfiA family n=1 Tax=Flavobacterium sp. TaxID=239 RepID=UPI0035293941